MPNINVFSEADQAVILESHNAGKKAFDKIPLLQRNFNTGWPLLQLSLFTAAATDDGSLLYEPALGGGKCHDFYIGAFSFANLLTKIPGGVIFNGKKLKQKEAEETVTFQNMQLFNWGFNHSFTFRHIALEIAIETAETGYGLSLQVNIPDDEGDSERLTSLLMHVNAPCKTGKTLRLFDTFHKNYRYSSDQINEAIDPEKAIFSNGQIFVDLGVYLNGVDSKTKDFLKRVFHVDEFLELKNSNPSFKPNESTSSSRVHDETEANISHASAHDEPAQSVAVPQDVEPVQQVVLEKNDTIQESRDPQPTAQPAVVLQEISSAPATSGTGVSETTPALHDIMKSVIASVIVQTSQTEQEKTNPVTVAETLKMTSQHHAEVKAETASAIQPLQVLGSILFDNVSSTPDQERSADGLKDFMALNRKKAYLRAIEPSLHDLYHRIHVMRLHGQMLADIHDAKSKVATKLADELEAKVDDFYSAVSATLPSQEDVTKFQGEFKTLLHSQDDAMKEHRHLWKPIVANILLALSGLGLIAIGIKTVANVIYSATHDEKITVNGCLFFAKTHAQKNIEAIEDAPILCSAG